MAPQPSGADDDDTAKLEAFLPKPIRKQIMRHLKTLQFGEICLIVEKGRVRFVRRTESEAATHY